MKPMKDDDFKVGMSDAEFERRVGGLGEQDRDDVVERAAIMEESNHWTREEANLRAWLEWKARERMGVKA